MLQHVSDHKGSIIKKLYTSSSSSIGTTAHCGLLACRTMSFHFFLSATNSLHLLTPSTWRSLSTSSFHLSLGLPLLLVPSSSWVKIFLGILTSSIISRWPKQLILCPFIHFTIFSPLLISSSSRFVRLFHSPFSYLGPYILLNVFLSKIGRAYFFCLRQRPCFQVALCSAWLKLQCGSILSVEMDMICWIIKCSNRHWYKVQTWRSKTLLFMLNQRLHWNRYDWNVISPDCLVPTKWVCL